MYADSLYDTVTQSPVDKWLSSISLYFILSSVVVLFAKTTSQSFTSTFHVSSRKLEETLLLQ